MPKFIYTLLSLSISGVILFSFNGCNKLTDVDNEQLPTDLVIAGISPDSAQIGSVIRITGSGFINFKTKGQVDFNGVPGIIISSSSSILQIKVPPGANSGPITLNANGKSAISSSYKIAKPNTGVAYITALTGSAKFSIFATLKHIPSTLFIDKSHHILYYADAGSFNDGSGLYKVSLGTGLEQKLTDNALITNVASITTDAEGNVYALVKVNADNTKYQIYKISAGGSSVKPIIDQTNLNRDINGGMFISKAKDIILLDHAFDQTGQKLTGYIPLNGKTAAAFFKNDYFYYRDANGFFRYDMATFTSVKADFTLQGLFGTDDYNVQADNLKGNGKSNLACAVDDQERFYAVYQHSYTPSQLTNTYFLRETKNGNGGVSKLLASFSTNFSIPDYPDPQGSAGGILMAADAAGNLYLRYNNNDLIKITH